MARITIEDCLGKIDNHFKLILIASHRARQLQQGVAPRIQAGNEKSGIIALREIAAGLVDEEILNDPLIKDDTADKELAELIRHETANEHLPAALDDGLAKNLDISNEKADLLAVSENSVVAGKGAGSWLSPDATEDIAGIRSDDNSFDHLKAGGSPEADDVLEKKLSDSEKALADKLLKEQPGE